VSAKLNKQQMAKNIESTSYYSNALSSYG